VETLIIFLGVVALGYYAYTQETGNDPLGLTSLSYSDVATLAANAGWTDDDLSIAIAVCFGESSGNPNAQNLADPNGGSFGLWQINQPNIPQGSNVFDPATNAAIAYSVWQSQGWSAWGAYTNGSYEKYLAQAQTAAGEING
jgi:hypothetical protein